MTRGAGPQERAECCCEEPAICSVFGCLALKARRNRKAVIRISFTTIFAAALLIVMLEHAFGQETWTSFQSYTPKKRMHLEPGDKHCYAYVAIENRAGSYNTDETLETAHGPVVIRYKTVGMHKQGDDDRAIVQSLPTDVLADPLEQTIVDGEWGRICLMRYQGL